MRQLNRLIYLCLFLTISSRSFPDSLGKANYSMKQLTGSEQARISQKLTAELKNDPLMPAEDPRLTGLDRSAPLRGQSGTLWLSPVHVKYRGLSNQYCLLGVFDPSKDQAWITPAPVSALNDACSKITSQHFVDANGGGVKDVVQLVSIQSNQGSYEVTQAMVYLAHADSPSGYCFSAQASREIATETAISPDATTAALKGARDRLKLKSFACGE